MDPDKTQRLTGTEAQEAQEPQPQSQPQPRKPQVGDSLLFHMGLGRLRPFIACSITDTAVTGLLLFAGEGDRHLPWVQCFSKIQYPSSTQSSTWATACHGWGVGEWHFPGEACQPEEGEGR